MEMVAVILLFGPELTGRGNAAFERKMNIVERHLNRLDQKLSGTNWGIYAQAPRPKQAAPKSGSAESSTTDYRQVLFDTFTIQNTLFFRNSMLLFGFGLQFYFQIFPKSF